MRETIAITGGQLFRWAAQRCSSMQFRLHPYSPSGKFVLFAEGDPAYKLLVSTAGTKIVVDRSAIQCSDRGAIND